MGKQSINTDVEPRLRSSQLIHFPRGASWVGSVTGSNQGWPTSVVDHGVFVHIVSVKWNLLTRLPDVGFSQPCSTTLLVALLSPQIRSEFTWGSRIVRIWLQSAKRKYNTPNIFRYTEITPTWTCLHSRNRCPTHFLFLQTSNMTTSAKNDTEYVLLLLNWKPFGTMKQRVGCCRASTTEWGRVAETRLE